MRLSPNWFLTAVFGSVLTIAAPCGAAQAAAPSYTTLYEFGAEPDAQFPGSLVRDKSGLLYGVGSGGGQGYGAVFSLTPPTAPGGAWTESVIHSFAGNDGSSPNALALDAKGVLYGTTNSGGTSGNGTVFRLAPPSVPDAGWSLTVLHNFTGGADGGLPAGLTIGSKGILYGTTSSGGIFSSVCGPGCGTVFQLTPPAAAGGSWTETTLYSFTNTSGDGGGPPAGVVMDANGVLYGTTFNGGSSVNGGGTVYALTPPSSPGGAWTETVLHSFGATNEDGRDPGGVVLGDNGALYGATPFGGSTNGGIAFELAPPATPGDVWTETVLFMFDVAPGKLTTPLKPLGVILGPKGVLYGSTEYGGTSVGGTVFQLTPPTAPGDPWRETTLHSFALLGTYSSAPGSLVRGGGSIYGTTSYGGAGPCTIGNRVVGCGTVFELTP